MASKLLALTCLRSNSNNNNGWNWLSTRPHYPSMPTYPKGVLVAGEEKYVEAKALFSVLGMSCSACAASVEKGIKRLPGIREALVDVLNNRAFVIFYPSFVDVRN